MTDSKAPELKPCPFCGGEAEIERYTIKPYVACMKCGCSMPDRHQTAEQAIEAWNARAEQAIAATLGSGTLTADDVLNAVYKHGARWQAIADELNATLGSGTCHMSFIDEYETASGEEEYLCECSECGSQTWEPAHDLPLYCRKCGRKVKR